MVVVCFVYMIFGGSAAALGGLIVAPAAPASTDPSDTLRKPLRVTFMLPPFLRLVIYMKELPIIDFIFFT
jgi:hypothetical protein